MTTTHTPGPWFVYLNEIHDRATNFNEDGSRTGETAELIATVSRYQDGRVQANLNLIAAAPDLLAALEAIVLDLAEAHAEEKYADHYGDSECSYCTDLETARTAIAKAKGL